MTYKQLYDKGQSLLKADSIDDAVFDARELLLFAAGISETQLLLKYCDEADAKINDAYLKLIYRRRCGEPVQYLIGRWSFLDCEFYVGSGVLIPRPETEQLAAMCINKVKKDNIKIVYDLCAGSGCIGISIARACPETKVVLFEKYSAAADYCRKNVLLNKAVNASVSQVDIFNGMPKGLAPAQLIVSNPPYIPADEIDGLQREVHFEPVTALDGGKDGLDFYRAIAADWLAPMPEHIACAVECGEGQADEIGSVFSPFGKTAAVTDIFGVRRFVTLNF